MSLFSFNPPLNQTQNLCKYRLINIDTWLLCRAEATAQVDMSQSRFGKIARALASITNFVSP